MITVACVLRSGGRYDASWAAKLRNGVARHLMVPHRFVCLTDLPRDVEAAGMEAIPLPEPWPGWWAKMCLWAPSAGLTGRTLYLDLDTVIVGSLDAIAAHPHRFTMAHEFYRPGLLCSTAMAWTGDWSRLYRAFAADPAGIMARYDGPLPGGRIGDQAFCEDVLSSHPVSTFRDLFGEKSVASYKVHCANGLSGEETVVSFHGSPKQDRLLHVDWIRENWY